MLICTYYFMKQFESLQFTYDRLVNEIQFLKKETITNNAEYNQSNDILRDVKEELEETRKTLKEEIYKNEVDIRNFNKNYREELQKRDKKLESLRIDLSNKKIKLNNDLSELYKKEIGIQAFEEKINSLQGKLGTKERDLVKRSKDIEGNEYDMERKESEFDKDMKIKIKEKIEIDIYIQWIRDESIKIKDSQKTDMEYILQQNNMFKDWEKRLNEQEQKISSDMRQLLSAKNHTNEPTNT